MDVPLLLPVEMLRRTGAVLGVLGGVSTWGRSTAVSRGHVKQAQAGASRRIFLSSPMTAGRERKHVTVFPKT
eukprot:8117124-Pyramimonas_sp.AAC.1